MRVFKYTLLVLTFCGSSIFAARIRFSGDLRAAIAPWYSVLRIDECGTNRLPMPYISWTSSDGELNKIFFDSLDGVITVPGNLKFFQLNIPKFVDANYYKDPKNLVTVYISRRDALGQGDFVITCIADRILFVGA